ncbi:hypothetical protein FOPG_19274 [Fusarium oxysporum f. sp. conglutinans race 2 54008]|uniref:Uncharacterized protein n=1 Tax=Fusarium oxysporum f. sp. conglutinans race 2 54008 TaxID=1089457 RepID=X0GLI5_FUSOX|nr:hypothetical protein FOPG_19274 [Fusarium oxysporum f. sp. conglutinans race 2 54008]
MCSAHSTAYCNFVGLRLISLSRFILLKVLNSWRLRYYKPEMRSGCSLASGGIAYPLGYSLTQM